MGFRRKKTPVFASVEDKAYPMDYPPYTKPAYIQPQPFITTMKHMIPNVPQTNVLIVGGCPQCRIGLLDDSFTNLGICCAFTFFPIGLFYLFTTREKKCANCDFTEN